RLFRSLAFAQKSPGNKARRARVLLPSAQAAYPRLRAQHPEGDGPMLNMSRRDFVVSTGLAAALGLNARLVVSPAFAQKTADPAKPFVTYKIGGAEVTAIYDGIWEKPHDPAFIANASVDDVKAAMSKAGLSPDFVSIPFTVAIVKTGGKTILCDSGTG